MRARARGGRNEAKAARTPTPRGEVEGRRKRAASDTSSGRKSTNVKATLQKRRRQRRRQDMCWKDTAIGQSPGYHGTGEQVQEVDGERDGE